MKENIHPEGWVYKGSPFRDIGPHVQLEKFDKLIILHKENQLKSKENQYNPLLRNSGNNFFENKKILHR